MPRNFAAPLAALLLVGCPAPEPEPPDGELVPVPPREIRIDPSEPVAEPEPEPEPEPDARPRPPEEPLRLEVNITARELYVYLGGERTATHRVAVGRPGDETPTGDFAIHRVDWNPDWRPPDSPWAEGREYKEPGHPDNPMGRVRLVFRAPYTIHGTSDLESLGEAASRGSIRMANSEIIELAPEIMRAGGAPRSREWIDEAISTPTEMREVELPVPVPLRIRWGHGR